MEGGGDGEKLFSSVTHCINLIHTNTHCYKFSLKYSIQVPNYGYLSR